MCKFLSKKVEIFCFFTVISVCQRSIHLPFSHLPCTIWLMVFASVLSPEALGCSVYFYIIFCFGTIGTFPPDLYRSVLESISVQSRSILESTSIDKLSLGSFLTRLSLSTQTFHRLFSDVLPVQNFSSAIILSLCFYVIFAFSSASMHAQKSGKPFIGLPLSSMISFRKLIK